MAAKIEAASPFVRPADTGFGASMPPAPPSFRLATSETPAPGTLRRDDMAAEAAEDGREGAEEPGILFAGAEPKVIVDLDDQRPSAAGAAGRGETTPPTMDAYPRRRGAAAVAAWVIVSLAVIAGGLYLLVRARESGTDRRADVSVAAADVAAAASGWDDPVEPDVPAADVGPAAEPESDADTEAVEEAIESAPAGDVAAPPSAPAAGDRDAATAALAEARRAWKARNRDGAFAGLREAARLDPTWIDPMLQWGRWVIDNAALYGSRERSAEAAEFLRPAADAYPNHGEMWFYYTAFLYRSGNRGAGDAAKAHCVDIRPRNDFTSGCRYLPD